MDNKIIGNVILNNATITFKGTNNIFYCKDTITLENCKIRFTGSNSLIYIDDNPFPFSLDIRLGNDSVFYLGKKCFVNRTSHMYATERKNILIGNECLIAFDTYFRTADPHLIYDTETKKRVNYSKSILIGDHVWVGQDCLVLKGTVIGSGSILGGKSVISNKIVESNTIYAGNPAKLVKKHVYYLNPRSTHDYTEQQELDSEFNASAYQYIKDETTVDLKKIDKCLQDIKTSQEKLEYIDKNLSNNNINRFCILKDN